MPVRERVVELVLRAKNLFSREADTAADSARGLSGTADDLNQRLRDLEDQKGLISSFQRASKAVDRTGAAYERARVHLANLEDKIEESGTATAKQTRELELARNAVARTSRAYDDAQSNLNGLAKEADDAGIELGDLNEAQRVNARETVKARRALEDYNKKIEAGEGRLRRFGRSLSTGAARLTAWTTAAAAAAGVLAFRALAVWTRDSAELARELSNASTQLGISTTRLQELGAATRTVGVDQDKLIDILKDMREKLGDAANGGGELSEELKRIGLDVNELIGLSPDEQLLKIADAIQSLPSEQQVTVLEAMASDASRLIPLLQNGAEGIERLAEAAAERGAFFTEEEIERLLRVQAAFERINDRLTNVRNRIVDAVLPTFEDLAKAIDEAFDGQVLKDFQTALEGLAVQMTQFVRDTTDDLGRGTGAVQLIIDTLQSLGNVAVAVFRTIQTALGTTTTILSSYSTAASKVVETVLVGLNKIGLASDEAVEKARARTQNLITTTQDLLAKTTEYGRQAREAGAAAIAAFDNTKDAADSARQAAGDLDGTLEEIVVTAEKIGDAAESAAARVEPLRKTQQQLGAQIAETALAIEAANAAWSEDPTDENLQKLQDLRSQYKALQDELAAVTEAEIKRREEAKKATEEQQRGAGAMDETADAAERASESVGDLGQSADEAGDQVESVGSRAVESARTAGQALASTLNGFRNHVAALSAAAVTFFDRELGVAGVVAGVDDLSARLQRVSDRLAAIRTGVSGSGVERTIRNWAEAALITERAFLSQALAAQEFQDRVESGNASMSELRQTASDVERRFDLLDRQRLSGLISAIRSARQEAESLTDSLEQAVASARSELASLRGDQAEVERIRFQERQLELQDQLNRARELGDAEAIDAGKEALRLAEQAHELRMEQLRERREAERQRAAEEAAQESDAPDVVRDTTPSPPTRQVVQKDAQVIPFQRQPLPQVVTLQIVDPGGGRLGSLSDLDPREVEELLRAIENSRFFTAG